MFSAIIVLTIFIFVLEITIFYEMSRRKKLEKRVDDLYDEIIELKRDYCNLREDNLKQDEKTLKLSKDVSKLFSYDLEVNCKLNELALNDLKVDIQLNKLAKDDLEQLIKITALSEDVRDIQLSKSVVARRKNYV